METEAKANALGGEGWLPSPLHARSWVRAAGAARGHAHSQSSWPWFLSSLSLQCPWPLFSPLLSSSFRLCCSSTAVQQGRVGEGRRKKFGGFALQKKREKKGEKAVLQGLGMLVFLPLPLPDPSFQTCMRRLLRTAPSRPRALRRLCAQAGEHKVPSTPGRGTARPGCSQTHTHACTPTSLPPQKRLLSFPARGGGGREGT